MQKLNKKIILQVSSEKNAEASDEELYSKLFYFFAENHQKLASSGISYITIDKDKRHIPKMLYNMKTNEQYYSKLIAFKGHLQLIEKSDSINYFLTNKISQDDNKIGKEIKNFLYSEFERCDSISNIKLLYSIPPRTVPNDRNQHVVIYSFRVYRDSIVREIGFSYELKTKNDSVVQIIEFEL